MPNSNTNHFDLEALRENLEYDEEFINNFLVLLKKELDVSFNILAEEFKKQNIETINTTAHRIKGTALNGCCYELSQLAATLEKTKPFNEEIISNLISKISTEIDFVKTLIP